MNRTAPLVTALVATLIPWASVHAGSYVAYSLAEAQRRIVAKTAPSTEVRTLGGITDLAGMVYDTERNDLILVGQANRGKPELSLDDLATAMRAVLRDRRSPLVSIDPTPETPTTRRQKIRWEGAIEDTKLGNDMLQADILLKKMALGKVRADVWGVRSYFALKADQAKTARGEGRIGSRFWFTNRKPSLAMRDGVFAIMDLDVGIETEVVYAEVDGRPVENLAGIRDAIGDAFANQVATGLGDLGMDHPELARARPILALVSLAEGMRRLGVEGHVSFWLNEYRVPAVPTPDDFELIEVSQEIDGRDLRLRVSGGMQLNPLVVRLKQGYVSALKDAVLRSRPAGNVLTWTPPLAGWRVPGVKDVEPEESPYAPSNRDRGCRIDCAVTSHGSGGFSSAPRAVNWSSAPMRSELPTFSIHDALPVQPTIREMSPRVGGVMLGGEATVAGAQGATPQLDLTSGSFSLIVEGEKAELDPAAFRRFVTALWSTYYSEQDPGISIDPIARGLDKHMVRYIGRVVNTDLGRVMRDADYVMKQWAVGTKRPDLPGFRTPDDVSARTGSLQLASSRFWFVPQGMRFRQGNGMLLFDDGRMTLRTEYLTDHGRSSSDPSNEAFAEWFTREYANVAAAYPVYQELFDYAKVVSLAKYLKAQKVPLFWFLMANRDLVPTEDSPGTVDALSRSSGYFEGVTIEGGVDLASKSTYVFDAEAVAAIQKARRLEEPPHSSASAAQSTRAPELSHTGPASFRVQDREYTALPQHSLTSGKDWRGIRYQTDMAFRREGEPGLELVRYFDPRRPEGGEFGNGWHLLLPYRLEITDSARREFQGAEVPERLTVCDLVTGNREVLTFSTDRYSGAGWVPAASDSGRLVGVFLMTDATFRLADKLGNQFWFDQGGRLSDLVLSEDYHVSITYQEDLVTDVPAVPYAIEPEGTERASFLNVSLPMRMRVRNLLSGADEVLSFSDEGDVAGYVPEHGRPGSCQILAIMTDGSFRLTDTRGTEVAFDAAGEFTGIAPAPEAGLVASMTLGTSRINLDYTVGPDGRLAVARARYSDSAAVCGQTFAVDYRYDAGGRLCAAEGPASRDVAVDQGLQAEPDGYRSN